MHFAWILLGEGEGEGKWRGVQGGEGDKIERGWRGGLLDEWYKERVRFPWKAKRGSPGLDTGP